MQRDRPGIVPARKQAAASSLRATSVRGWSSPSVRTLSSSTRRRTPFPGTVAVSKEHGKGYIVGPRVIAACDAGQRGGAGTVGCYAALLGADVSGSHAAEACRRAL